MNLKRREFLGGTGAAALSATFSTSPEDPIESLSDMVAGMDPPPASEIAARIQKLQSLLEEQRVDAFLVEAGPTLEYFTGVRWGRSERTFAAIIPRTGNPSIVCPAFEKGRAQEQINPVTTDAAFWQEHESPFQLLARILRENNSRLGKVAVEPTTRYFVVSGLSQYLPAAEMVSGQLVSDRCRMSKSGLELAYMRKADEITKKAFHAALQGLREGMTQDDLNQRIVAAHGKMGVRGGALVLFGPASASPHGTRENRKLREGDIVLIDGGCRVHGYWSDVTRTAVFGKPSSRQKEVWAVVLEAQDAVLEIAAPGVPCEALDRAARSVIERSGFGPDYRYFTHRLGHGVGLEGHETPYIVQGNSLAVQPGMTFSNEPGIYLTGRGGVRIEDLVGIENGEIRVISKAMKREV